MCLPAPPQPSCLRPPFRGLTSLSGSGSSPRQPSAPRCRVRAVSAVALGCCCARSHAEPVSGLSWLLRRPRQHPCALPLPTASCWLGTSGQCPSGSGQPGSPDAGQTLALRSSTTGSGGVRERRASGSEQLEGPQPLLSHWGGLRPGTPGGPRDLADGNGRRRLAPGTRAELGTGQPPAGRQRGRGGLGGSRARAGRLPSLCSQHRGASAGSNSPPSPPPWVSRGT